MATLLPQSQKAHAELFAVKGKEEPNYGTKRGEDRIK
jgi:hypothetical protein